MKKLLLIPLGIFFNNHLPAQDYVTEGRKRLNFAKTYVELNSLFTPSFSGQMQVNSQTENFKKAATMQPFLHIGGFHFWGHADFYFSIPLSSPIKLGDNLNDNFKFNQSIVTGARIFPFTIKNNAIRPFIGSSWSILNMSGNENQPLITKSKLIFDLGMVYTKKDFVVRFGFNLYPSNKWNYPVTKTDFQSINPPMWSSYLGLVYAFETTRSKNMKSENQRINDMPRVSSPTKKAMKMGDWFLGIGPSTSFIVANSSYNQSLHPYFNKKPISNTFLDFALGYQFNRLGLVSSLAYRNPKFSYNGFGTEQTVKKNSLTFEVYKYLIDYSGFTPYLGVNLNFNNVDFSEVGNKASINKKFKQVTPGFTFGWDILPGKTEQWVVLRTNLRWFPFDKIHINDKTFSLNQIEYNVIQLVLYPSRYKNSKSKRD